MSYSSSVSEDSLHEIGDLLREFFDPLDVEQHPLDDAQLLEKEGYGEDEEYNEEQVTRAGGVDLGYVMILLSLGSTSICWTICSWIQNIMNCPQEIRITSACASWDTMRLFCFLARVPECLEAFFMILLS